jgi:hypothetical protein
MKLLKVVLTLSLFSYRIYAQDTGAKPIITREACGLAIHSCAEEFMEGLLGQMSRVKLLERSLRYETKQIVSNNNNDATWAHEIIFTNPYNPMYEIAAQPYSNSSDLVIKCRFAHDNIAAKFDIRALPIVKYRVLSKGHDALGRANFMHDQLAIEKIIIPEGPDKEHLVDNETKLVTVFTVNKKCFVDSLRQLLNNPPVEVMPEQEINKILGIKEDEEQEEAEKNNPSEKEEEIYKSFSIKVPSSPNWDDNS